MLHSVRRGEHPIGGYDAIEGGKIYLDERGAPFLLYLPERLLIGVAAAFLLLVRGFLGKRDVRRGENNDNGYDTLHGISGFRVTLGVTRTPHVRGTQPVSWARFRCIANL